MAYIFVDDGYPEASDYANNYVSYDPENPESVRRAQEKAAALKADRETPVRSFGLRWWVGRG